MEQLLETTYEFTPATGANACCGLRIVQVGTQTIVILTELPNNPGMTITNAAEKIAAQIRRGFDVDPDQTRWIEHYPERVRFAGRGLMRDPKTYDEIFFTWKNNEAQDPIWRRLTPEEVEMLLGTGEP